MRVLVRVCILSIAIAGAVAIAEAGESITYFYNGYGRQPGEFVVKTIAQDASNDGQPVTIVDCPWDELNGHAYLKWVEYWYYRLYEDAALTVPKLPQPERPAYILGGGAYMEWGHITVAVCGNGLVEPGEQCDDGNCEDGDGCSSSCTLEGPQPPEAFGSLVYIWADPADGSCCTDDDGVGAKWYKDGHDAPAYNGRPVTLAGCEWDELNGHWYIRSQEACEGTNERIKLYADYVGGVFSNPATAAPGRSGYLSGSATGELYDGHITIEEPIEGFGTVMYISREPAFLGCDTSDPGVGVKWFKDGHDAPLYNGQQVTLVGCAWTELNGTWFIRSQEYMGDGSPWDERVKLYGYYDGVDFYSPAVADPARGAYIDWRNTGYFVLGALDVWVDAVNGDDSNPGTEALPVATIQKGLDIVAEAGIVHVAAGTYAEEVMVGGAKTGVSILGESGAVLDGGFYVAASSTTIDGFTISNGRSSTGHKVGVMVVGATGCTISNNVIQNVTGSQSTGIEIGYNCDNLLVESNEIKDCWRGVYINASTGLTVRGNWIHHNNGVGVGIGSDGLSDFLLEGNIIADHTLEGWGSSNVGANVVARWNVFSGNGTAVAHYGGQPISAANNWWGSYAGPGATDGGGRTGDPVSGLVNTDPVTLGLYGVDSDSDGTNDDSDADDDDDGSGDADEVAAGTDPLDAGELAWRGIGWNMGFGSAQVSDSDRLQVSTTSVYGTSAWGAAHYGTPDPFRAASSTWIQASFIDQGPGTVGGQLWFEHEPLVNHAWAQIGCWETRDEYRVYWWNYQTGETGWFVIGERTAGEHTVKVGKRADGTVDFWFDGLMVFSTTKVSPDYIGDVYLAAHSSPGNAGDTVEFTDYQCGTDYEPMRFEVDLSGQIHTENPCDTAEVGDWMQVGPLGPNGTFDWGRFDNYSAPGYLPQVGSDLDHYGWAMEGTLDSIDGDLLTFTGEYWICPEGYGYDTKELAIEHGTFTIEVNKTTGETTGTFIADEGSLQPPGWPEPTDWDLANPGSFSGTVDCSTGDLDGSLTGVADVSDGNLLALNVEDVYAQPGETVTVTLDVSNLMQPVNGCQAVASYDTSHLTLTAITEGGGDWDTLIYPSTIAMLNPGEIDVAVGVTESLSVVGTRADATLAVFTFTAGAEGQTFLDFRPDVSEIESTIFGDITANAVYPAKVASPTIYIDGTAPTITQLAADPATWTNANTVDILFAATDDNAGIDTYELSVDGGAFFEIPETSPYTLDVSTLADGEPDVTLRVTDNAGNAATASINLQLDKTAPTNLQLSADKTDWINQLTDGPVQLTFSADGSLSGVQYYELKVDDGSVIDWFQATSPYDLDVTGLSDGIHTVYMRATDNAGNTNAEADWASVQIKLDATDPVVDAVACTQYGVDLLPGTPNAVQDPVEVVVTVSDATSGVDGTPTVTVTPNGGSAEDVTTTAVEGPAGTFTYTFNVVAATPNGLATITVTVTDNAGNTAVDSSNTFNVNKNQVAGSVELEQLAGGITRTVTFVVTHGSGTTRFDVDVAFPSGSSIGTYRLTTSPAATCCAAVTSTAPIRSTSSITPR